MAIFLAIGRLINLFIFKDLKGEKNIIFDVLSGIIYLSFAALILNFFFPLNTTLNNIILLISFFALIKIYQAEERNLFSYMKIIFLIGSVSFLIILLDHSYSPDAGLYHLPYISILNEYKTIIGISNVHFRFGHTSIIQYTSAIFNNSLFSTKGITLPISIILSTVILFFIKTFLKKKNNYFFLVFFFLTTVFILLKNSRYNDIGNDVIGHLFYFLVLSIFLDQIYFNKQKYINFFYLSLFCIFAFANKVFLFTSFLFPIFFIIYFKKYNFLYNFKNSILIIFLLSLFIKNVLVSSCIIYPINTLCFDNLSWSAIKKEMHANPERRGIESEVASKGWADLKNPKVSKNEFNKNFTWLPTWLNKHFKYLIVKLLPLISIIFIILIILYKTEKNRSSIKRIKDKNNLINKIFYVCFSINLIGCILWFLKFPLYRYGYSFIVSAIILLASFAIYKFFYVSRIEEILKKLKYILLISIIFVVLNNLNRIVKKYNFTYNDYPWPNIYAYDETNLEQNNSEILFLNDFKIYNPKYRLCMYSKGPCTHFEEVTKQIKVKNKLSYYIIIPSIF